MQAIQLLKYGEPEEGLQLAEIAEPDLPKLGQILIRVEYAPINDNDLLLARGLYTIHPNVPRRPCRGPLWGVLLGGEGISTG